MHCLQRVKRKIGPVIFFFSLLLWWRIFHHFTFSRSCIPQPNIIWHATPIGFLSRFAEHLVCIHGHFSSSFFFSSCYEMLDALFHGLFCREPRLGGGGEGKDDFFLFDLMSFSSIRMDADRFSVFISSIPSLLSWNIVSLGEQMWFWERDRNSWWKGAHANVFGLAT